MLAAALFGALMGAAAWIRAVALPLVAFGAFYLRARGTPWRMVVKQTALAGAVAAVLLAPWALRNRARYGELFFTDSHGGLTALVGANPNSEGTYSRSLNRIFFEVTGRRLLDEPHREADRAAYALARDWTAFEPLYALGLAIAKAERLLEPQRALLYWPVYRQGVLRPPQGPWFDERRRELEAVTDLFWGALVAAGLFGLGAAVARRAWTRLAFVPTQLALIGIYTLFFAEIRYQLPIALLLFPPAGAAVVWAAGVARRLLRERALPADVRREALAGALAVAVVFAGWPALTWAGERLREGHRWAAHACWVDGQGGVCKWRRAGDRSGAPVQGVWNGVGMRAIPGAAIEARLELPAGRYRLRASLDLAPLRPDAPAPPAANVSVVAGTASSTVPFAQLVAETRAGRGVPLSLELDHPGGALLVRVAGDGAAEPWIWLSDLRLERR